MGLRETKAARSRERMVAAALELFETQGYDATTMEQVAQHAEVGTTTLYRYFPSKDLLLLDRFGSTIELAPRLRSRPDDEPLAVALGEALLAVARAVDDAGAPLAQLRRLIDESAAPRARVWDVYRDLRVELEAAICERIDWEPGSLPARMTAGLTLEVLQVVDEASRRGGAQRSYVETTREVLAQLPDTSLVAPSAPSPPSALAAPASAG